MECVRARAICEPVWRQAVDSAASLCTVLKTVHNDAVESTVCRRSGSRIARLARSMQTPKLACAWSA
eukprot:7925895-Lingulodinium_polyedra.AAC.1